MPKIKGKRARAKSFFKRGHALWKNRYCGENENSSQIQEDIYETKKIVRMSKSEFDIVVKTNLDGSYTQDAECGGVSNTGYLLRPKMDIIYNPKTDNRSQLKGMRLIDSTKMTQTWNEAFMLHQTNFSECLKPNFEILQEKKWGLGWRIQLHCTNCDFRSNESKLYKEVPSNKSGPRAAAVNVGLSIGLQDTPMGNTRARVLLACMDIPPPCLSSMQKTANKISNEVTVLNQKDMCDKLKLVMDVNEKRGNDKSQIIIAMDARYNSVTITSRKKPGQNASQAIGLACETMTDKKFIVGASFVNKLCWVGAWLRGQGFEVKCPGGHANCTANLSYYAPFSEYTMGKEIGEKLSHQGAIIQYVTTDGDAKSSLGISDAMKLVDPILKVTRFADPVHLGQAQFRSCMKANFSSQMFPGYTTREQKYNAQKVFSQDVKARCSLVLKDLMQKHAGDLTYLRNCLPKVLEATLLCYNGDCSKCYRNSVVCSGGVSNNWFQRSMFLAGHKITVLHLSDNDNILLLELLKMRLSIEAVEMVRFYTDTQKCEAANRSLSVSLPKNVNFSRNMAGRASSTIHRLNNGLGESAILKCENSGIELSPRVEKCLRSMDRQAKCIKEFKHCSHTRKHHMDVHARHVREHANYRAKNKERSDYKKGQLDHSYSK